MLVSKKKKAVLLRSRDPKKLTAQVPKAQIVKVQGKDFVAAPHNVSTTKILRNLGYSVPSPIRHHYQWPGRYTPFHAQREAAAFLSMHDRAFNLSEMGTGKTMASLWAYDYLRSAGLKNKVLIIAPLSTLECTWATEIFTNFMHLKCNVLHGAPKKRLKLLNEKDADVYVVNPAGVQVIEPALAKRPDIDLVIVDEVQCARNASTNLWKSFNRVINLHADTRATWGMTGTPTPSKPTDAWAQCRLVVPATVPRYQKRFQDQTMMQVSPWKWVARKTATKIVHAVMQPSVRFTMAECTDLPPVMYQTRGVGLTAPQQKAYADMFTKLRVEAANGDITAVNEGVKLSKLVQIACGVAYDEHGAEVILGAKDRIDEAKTIVTQAEGKVIVFAPFVSAVNMVAKEMSKDFTVEKIHGGIPKNERDRIFNAFQREPDPRVLVAQPAAMAHGLTLTEASAIVWYSCITSNEIFEQANARITRPGQKRNTFVICLEGSTVEKRMYARLKSKQQMQGALLEEIKATSDEQIY